MPYLTMERCHCQRKRRRRYLAVPQSERELSKNLLEDAYCDGNTVSLSSQQKCCNRPLPSTQSLLSSYGMNGITTHVASKTDSSKLSSSLMEIFYQSIGASYEGADTTDKGRATARVGNSKEGNGKKALESQILDDIDDPSLSTLRLGHHKRYLKYTTEFTPYTQRKELQSLKQLVKTEQTAYNLALDTFHERNKLRYTIGVKSGAMVGKNNTTNAICRFACSYSQAINEEWNNNMQPQLLSKTYGKVRQTLGVQSQSRRSPFDVEDLNCTVVHKTSPTTSFDQPSSPTCSSTVATFSYLDNNNNNTILSPKMEFAPSVTLLKNDKKALELATRYSASIVTTSESLETLLQLPGEYSAKWMLLVSTKSVTVSKTESKSPTSVKILDVPIAQAFSSPRACLESGMQEALYQTFQQQNQHEQVGHPNESTVNDSEGKKIKSITPTVTQYYYCLWTLPCNNKAGRNNNTQKLRVLIRTLVRLKDSKSKLPVRLRAHIEYHRYINQERKELPNSYETSLWILDQVLFEHQATCLQYRIDPTNCRIIGCDVTSIAHAFAISATSDLESTSSSSVYNRHDPSKHWVTLVQLLQSIHSIDVSNCLLCLPGRVGEKNVSSSETKKNISGREKVATASSDASGMIEISKHQRLQIRIDPFSVSVHAPYEETTSSVAGIPTIDLDDGILDQAGSVILSDQALRDCRRNFVSNRPGLIPNTFPPMNYDK